GCFALILDFFEHFANFRSLHPPQAAVAEIARAFGARVRHLYFIKTKTTHMGGFCFGGERGN
ncbi:MAG: hypothetical protein IJ424_08075, partial [Oscillospiraceae bacterium]|nr:hypothetical protein [Oscillospiraceae bacterium]